jgi:hypothetical protein
VVAGFVWGGRNGLVAGCDQRSTTKDDDEDVLEGGITNTNTNTNTDHFLLPSSLHLHSGSGGKRFDRGPG